MQKYANLVDLEKCCQTHIYLQNLVSIQPRTSPPKIRGRILIVQTLFILSFFDGGARRPGTRGYERPTPADVEKIHHDLDGIKERGNGQKGSLAWILDYMDQEFGDGEV